LGDGNPYPLVIDVFFIFLLFCSFGSFSEETQLTHSFLLIFSYTASSLLYYYLTSSVFLIS